jgi:Cof subfamily protein (haloacid dehalogenase superfamily)
MNKLILFDLDDTLLTTEKTITPYTVETIKSCKERGMFIGYITGRAFPMNNEVFFTDKYELPKDFIAYYNGAKLYAGNVSIENNIIPYKDAMKIIRSLDGAYPNAKIGVYHEPWSYLKRNGCSEGENWNIQTGEKIKCGLFELPEFDVQRIRIEFGKDDDKNQLNDFMTKKSIYFINADGSAMIINKDATKENALKKAAEYFNIPLADVIAFGDDVNDMDMLKTAGIGVAMGNALEKVKDAADYICDTNDNDGIAKWIQEKILN